MSHVHFGRAVPIIFRRFPSLVCHNLLGKTMRVPQDLEGQLNVLVVGFKTSHYTAMSSWMPFANRLKKEICLMQKMEEPLAEVYRLVIRQHAGVLFRWWTDERLRLAIGDGTFENSEIDAGQAICEDHESFLDVGDTLKCPKTETLAKICNASEPKGVIENSQEALRASKLQWVRSRTLVSFTDKSAFVEALQLADAQRVYIFIVSRNGEIGWCEHEAYSAAKETDIHELLLRLPTPGTISCSLTPENVGLLPPNSRPI